MLFLSSVLELEPEVPLQQHHQRVDFGARPLPVLDRERVERQHVDAEPRRGFDDVAHRIDAGAVAFDARQVALRRPAAVAVHDDGDVGRQLIEVDLPRQRFVGRSWRNPRQELLKRHADHYKSAVLDRRRGTAPRRAPSDRPASRSREASTSRIRLARPSPAADLHQRAGDRPDHVAQKSVAGDLVDDQLAATEDADGDRSSSVRSSCELTRDRDHGPFGRARASRRRLQTPRSRAALRASAPPHPSRRRPALPAHVPRVVALERADHVGVPDPVAVGLRAGVEARVEIGARPLRPTAPGRPAGSRALSARTSASALDRRARARTRRPAQRVNARVGPAGAGDGDVAAVELAERVLDQALNRRAGRLALPADVVRAVVGEGELEVGIRLTQRSRRHLH